MARYTGPKTKIARKFGEPIYGPDKYFENSHRIREPHLSPGTRNETQGLLQKAC